MELKGKLLTNNEAKLRPIWTLVTIAMLVISMASVYRHGSKSIVEIVNNSFFSYSMYTMLTMGVISIISLYLYEQRKSKIGEIILQENLVMINNNESTQDEFSLEKISRIKITSKDSNTYVLTFTREAIPNTYIFTIENKQIEVLKSIEIRWKTLYAGKFEIAD